jgi:hypothetical protein
MRRESDTANTFLQQFFGQGNRLDLQKIDGGDPSYTPIKPWVDRFRLDPDEPAVLPCWRKTGMEWYGLAHSESQRRALGETLKAFIGPTWGAVSGQMANLNTADPVEAAVADFTAGFAFRFQGLAPAAGQPSQTKAGLDLMLAVWQARTAERGQQELTERTTGRVLRDIFLALQAGDGPVAERNWEYLRDKRRLDTLNQTFLKLQILAGLRRWDDLLSLAEGKGLLRIRRPRAVSQVLIQAVYYVHIAHHHFHNQPGQALETFRAQVLPNFGDLWTTYGGSDIPAVIATFALAAACEATPSPALIQRLQKDAGQLPVAEQDFIWNLLATIPTQGGPAQVTDDPSILAQGAANALRYDEAILWAMEMPVCLQRTKLLFECAYNLDTLEAEHIALEAFDELIEADQHALLSAKLTREYYFKLVGGFAQVTPSSTAIPNDWTSWLHRLRTASNWDRVSALTLAQRGSQEWPIDVLVDGPAVQALLSELMATRSPEADTTLSDALPSLIAFLQRDSEWPRPALSEIYGLVHLLLAADARGSEAALAAFTDIAVARLQCGISPKDYRELLETADHLWQSVASEYHTTWLLDLIDILAGQQCPDPAHRKVFAESTMARLRDFRRRLDDQHREVIRLLASDLQIAPSMADLMPVEGASSIDDNWMKLNGKSILIYTLTESVAIRVKQILTFLCPTLTVHLSSDKDGNPRLKQLAQQSDVAVVATASSKHAATNFIGAWRSKTKPTLMPSGKGSASMLRCVSQYLSQLA